MRYFWALSLVFFIWACSDDSSSSGFESVDDGEFWCKVSTGENWVRTEMNNPEQGKFVSKVTKQKNGLTLSRSEDWTSMDTEAFLQKCDSLFAELNGWVKSGSFVCKDFHVEYVFKTNADGGLSLKDMKAQAQDFCYKEEEAYRNPSSSSAKPDTAQGNSSQAVESSSGGKSSSSEAAQESRNEFASSSSYGVLFSSSSYGMISSSSSYESPCGKDMYCYVYVGSGEYSDSSLAIRITSNCVDSECFEDFEDYNFAKATVTTSTEGVDGGKALLLKGSEYIVLPWDLNKQIDVGSLDFYFKPDSSFDENATYQLVGNDGARMSVVYSRGTLYFYKNHADVYVTVFEIAQIKKNQWNRITAEWNARSGYIALFLDGNQIAVKETALAEYSPSDRGSSENVLMVGYKGGCCMDIFHSAIYGIGAFDNIRVATENIFGIVVPAVGPAEP